MFSKTFLSWCISNYTESLCHSGRSLPKREWAVSTCTFCTMDYREICSSSAEVANIMAVELLLSCCGPAGSSLGCEEEGPGMPRDCAGLSISPTLSFSFIVSKVATVHSGAECIHLGQYCPVRGGSDSGRGVVKREKKVREKRPSFFI